MAASVITGTLLCLLALDLVSVVNGQTTCRGIRCVTNANSCNAAKRCQCDPGLAGDGRTICVADRCVCSSVADPHMTLYDSAANPAVTANLHCTYQMTSYADGANSCDLAIVHMNTETRGTGNEANFRVFASGLKAVTLDLANSMSTTTTTVNAMTTGTPNANGFTTVSTPVCDLQMGYNETYGSVYISTPTGLTYSNVESAVCGNCDGMGEENPGTTPQSHLSYMLQRLSPAANQQTAPYTTQCSALRTAAASCTANIVTAGQVCHPWISKDFGLCLLSNSNVASYTALMDSFVSCVQNVCSSATTAACTALVAADTSSASCALSPRPAACP